jgi:hypothetical protein
MIHDPLIHDWLERFAACVRQRDLEAGMALFDPVVHAFGTRMEHVHDLQALVEQQWRPVWFNTRDFRFIRESLQAVYSADRSQVCVLGLWDSQGVAAGGGCFLRRGRCTIVLRKSGAVPNGYKAGHTHFSKMPEGSL